MSSSTAWDIGISAAPKSPWKRRAATISGRVCASPQSAENTVKPTTEAMNTRLRPTCPASQPESGVMIAAAMMYEVRTQAIWSCVAESEPWMRGSATFAMVLSSACMIEASITESVMSPRWGAGASPGNAAAAALMASGSRPPARLRRDGGGIAYPPLRRR